MTPSERETVSIVIPLHNEEGNVAPLVSALAQVREPGWNVVFVDDGSNDGTFVQLREVAAAHDWIGVVVLKRRVGQAAALKAGFDHAKGELLVTMDGDLQNDPADIGLIVEQLRGGAGFVIGRRMERRDRWLDRKLPSWIANRLITWSLRVPFRDIGCGLRGYRRSLVEQLWWWNEFHRYASIIAFHLGERTVEVDVQSHPRIHGKAKYGLGRIGRILRDLVVLLAFTKSRASVTSVIDRYLWVAALCATVTPGLLEFLGFTSLALRGGIMALAATLVAWLGFRHYSYRYYANALWGGRVGKGYQVEHLIGL